MNIKKLFFCAFSSLMFFLPSVSNAIIIDGAFKAKVTGADPAEGLWGDIRGQTVTGAFSYDTALFETTIIITPNESRYISNNTNAFVNMTFSIAGHTFDISHDYTDALPAISQHDMLIVQDAELGLAKENYDYFMLLDSLELGDPSSDYIHTTGQFYFFDPVSNFINNLDPEQEFRWVNEGKVGQFGYGSFYYNYNVDGSSIFSFVNLDITEVTASARKSSVPEPASLVLSCIALLGVTLRFRARLLKSG